MSDGNKFDLTSYARQRQQAPISLEEMGNVLLDAMQGTLICLDNHHIIIDVSKTIKQYFGFEQCDIVGISILLLIEDSERDLFLKFLSSTSQLFDICYVRMMIAISNEYRQVKVHRKRKFSQDNADVHSTTAISNGSLGSILVLTLEDSSFIDLSLSDIYKQEFYTKMNLLGEITFEDHRGTLITGYLPHELTCQSIFNFVYHEDRLVKLHALWKCVTTGASKLQWRFNARDGSLVFLQTEYKLVANHQDHETIVARNEVLSPVQRSQFEELQTAWRHQCAADIKGNSSSFKLITSIDIDPLSISSGQCCISVPSLNMCFSTKKLQSLHIQGNIFDGTKQTRPLTIQDYISLLIEHDKYLDNELMNIINNISNITSRTKRQTNENDSSDVQMKEKTQDDDLSRRKSDSDSIVRGILNNSIKYTQEKPTGDLNSTFNQLLNGNSQTNESPLAQQTNQMNQVILNPEAIQQQHIDFIKKYRSAKAKLESQLESTRTQELANGGQTNDALKRHTILNKLAQLENIKNKHLARTFELQRQTQQAAVAPQPQPPLPPPAPAQPVNQQQKDLMNNYFPSPSPKSSGLMSTDSNPPAHPINQSALYNTPPNNFYPQQQRHPPTSYRTYDSNPPPYHDPQSRMKMPVFDEYSTPPPSYMPMNNSSLSVHSYMNVSFQETNTNSPSTFNHHNTTYPF